MNEARLIIVTRLGIGISRPSFFRQHVEVMRVGLARSLAAQTERNFEWVVVADTQIDADSQAALERVLSAANGRLVLLDPVVTGRLAPIPKDVLDDANDGLLVLSRIDDDDALHREFVARLHQTALDASGLPCSVAFADGLDVYPAERLYRPYHHPTIPVGLSVVSRGDKPVSPYGGNHTRQHERIEALGGTSIISRTEKPMWLYTRNVGSDSSEHRAGRLPKTRQLKRFDGVCEGTIQACGLDSNWATEVVHARRELPDPRPPVVGTKKLNRLQIKAEMLRYLRELRQTGGADSPRYHAAISAFYAL